MRLHPWLVPVLGALLATPCSAQIVGSPLPPATVIDLHETGATALEEYQGRLLLLEFFAHW